MSETAGNLLLKITVRDYSVKEGYSKGHHTGRIVFTAQADLNNQKQVKEAMRSLCDSMNIDIKRIVKTKKERELDFFGITWEGR